MRLYQFKALAILTRVTALFAWPVPSRAENIVSPANAGLIIVTNAPYNAKGDGVTDDTAAIRATLSNANQRTVELAPGLFAYLFEDQRDAVAVVIPQGAATGTLPGRAPGITARDVPGNDLTTPVTLRGSAVFWDVTGQTADALAKLISQPSSKH